MTLEDIVEEVFQGLQDLVIEYLIKAQASGEDAETVKQKAYAILDANETPREMREVFLEEIAILDGVAT